MGRRWRQQWRAGLGSPSQRGVFSTPGPTSSCSPRPPGAKGTRKRQRTAAAARGQHSQRSGKSRAKGHRPRLHRQRLPRASPGRHSLCPFGPGGRKVDGPAATGSPDRRAGRGEQGAGCPSQAGEQRPQPPEDPWEPRGAPTPDGKQGKSGNEYMKSWGRRGTSAAMSSGRVTGAPATEQAWPCWGGRGG